MSNAYDTLAGLVSLAASEAEPPVPLNVYPIPTGLVVPPGVVIQPGDPWWEPAGFDIWRERYELVCFTRFAEPASAYRELHALVRLVFGALAQGGELFHLERFTAPRADDSTGSTFLTSTAHITTTQTH